MEPSNWPIQYTTALINVMLPPTKAPNVTAGLTCPPEMFAPTETATNSAKAWDNAAAIRPDGVVPAPCVSLPVKIPTVSLKLQTENDRSPRLYTY